MAYDAAVASCVDQCLIDSYVASCLKLDAAWYVEVLKLSRREQHEMEIQAVDAVFSRMEEFLAEMGVEPYISAPIVSDERWAQYVSSLPTFVGVAADALDELEGNNSGQQVTDIRTDESSRSALRYKL